MENPNWRQVLASILGISVLGVIGYLGGARTKSPAPAESPKKIQQVAAPVTTPEVESANKPTEEKKIILDIGGAVAKPGVYWIYEGARLDELVVLAGGLLPTADRDRINMATVLRDGSKVTIPYRQEAAAGSTPPPVSNNQSEPDPNVTAPETTSGKPQVETPRVLNVNQASGQDFQSLPGIGQELAGRIVKYREGVGGFKSVDELKQVRGIGDKLFDRIRGYLTL